MLKPLFIAALLCGRLSPLFAQATPTVRPDDPVYGFIDHLIAMHYVDSVIVGQRPMSAREIGRILAAATVPMTVVMDAPTSASDPDMSWTARSFWRYRRLYPAPNFARRKPALRRVRIDVTTARSPSRTIPPDGNGAIDVDVNPLLTNQLGVQPFDGRTDNVSVEAELPIQSWLTAVIDPRHVTYDHKGRTSGDAGRIDQLYLRGLFRNLAVTAGRDYVFFGQGQTAGITNSLNPGGFDMVRLSSERPFVLPSLLHLLGPVSGTLFVADLGQKRFFPHSRLINYKLSARPFSALELGVTVTDEMGGQGAPGGTFAQKMEDLVPILDATLLHRVLVFSNKFSGVDARWRVPHARGLQLYMDGAVDDFDLRRLKSSLTEDAGYIWGGTYDCFGECGRVKLTGEYHATGVRYYTHGIFKTGYTLQRQFIGDPLGPRGKGMYLSLGLDRITSGFTLDLAHEIRSGDKYGATSTTPNDSDFRFIIIEHNPAERRWRSVLTMRAGHQSDWATLNVSVGGERVEHFAFKPGTWRTNSLFEIREELHLGMPNRFKW
jgi:hypothetical protein